MIKQFDNNSYVQITKSNGKVSITVAAADSDNHRAVIVNSAEVTIAEFDNLISDVLDKKEPKPIKKKTTKKKTAKKKKTTKKAAKKADSSE